MEYDARLMAAGVPVELQDYPGAYHGFEMVFESDLAVRAEADRRRALAAAFRR